MLLAIVGLLFIASAVLPLRDGDFTGVLVFVGLGALCLVAARSGRDPLDPDGSARSFRINRVADDLERLRREDDARD